MLSKNKILYQCAGNEALRKHHPFAHDICKEKKKNNAKNKNYPAAQPNVVNAKLKHAPSKSNLQMPRNEAHFQQKWAHQEPQNKRNSTLRFTDLLQNSKNLNQNNHTMCHTGLFYKNNQNDLLSSFQNSKKISQTHQVDELNATSKMNRMNTKIYDENSVNRCIEASNSIEYIKKSPMRLVNTNKLNNTPKLIDLSSQHHNHRDNELNSKSKSKAKNSINLQCSEKIAKFIDDSRKINGYKGKAQQKHSYLSKNKSNLLSTGIINFSYPKDISNPFLDDKDSKNNLFANENEFNIKAFCKQGPKEFQEFSSGKVMQNEQKIQKLFDRSTEMGTFLETILNTRQKKSITHLINQHFNPQNIHKPDIQQKILQMRQLKESTMTKVQNFCQSIMKISYLYAQNINCLIKSLEQSQRTGIQWYSIQKQLSFTDDISNMKLKNEILIQRISFCKSKLSQCDEDSDETIDDLGLQQVKKEISSIDTQLLRNEHLLNQLLNHANQKNNVEIVQVKDIGRQQLQMISIEIARFNQFMLDLNPQCQFTC